MVAVDAMGGDYAPLEICKGVLLAAKQGIPITLFGPEDLLQRILDAQDPLWKTYSIQVAHAPDIIEMGEEPFIAVRKKQKSSLVRAVASVKAGACSAVISAGSSGALMAAATLILGRLPGIDRPGIAGFLPSKNGHPVVAVDLGACVEAKPAYLYQFAELGVAYAQAIFGLTAPRVGLLANGSEDSKGNALTKEVFGLLKASPLLFVGNIEPEDIFNHKIDVVVTEGFSGNILLKAMEATCAATLALVQQQAKNHVSSEEQAVVFQVLKKTKQSLLVADQGGALLLGVCGTVVVAHGSATAESMERGILLAYKSSDKEHQAAWSDRTYDMIKKREMSL